MRQPPEGMSARTPLGKSSAAGRIARQTGDAHANAEMPPATTSRNVRRPYGRSSGSRGGNDDRGVRGRGDPETRPPVVGRQRESRAAVAPAVDHEPADRDRAGAFGGLRPQEELAA